MSASRFRLKYLVSAGGQAACSPRSGPDVSLLAPRAFTCCNINFGDHISSTRRLCPCLSALLYSITITSSDLVARVLHLGRGNEFLLQSPHVHKSAHDRRASCLVVGARCPRATKRLLSDHCTRALAVDVEVTSRVPERVLRNPHRRPIRREYRAGESVLRCGIDQLAGLDEASGCAVVVHVSRQDGAEELCLEVRVCRIRRAVDGRLHEVALGAVERAAGDQLELVVLLRRLDRARELVERRSVDDWADEVLGLPRHANLQLLRLLDQLLLELGPHALGHVDARGRAAFLALELECTAHCLDGSVVNVRRGVDDVEVLAASLAHNARVAHVASLGNALANLAVQLAEHGSAARVVESGELLVAQHDLGDLLRLTWDELDHVLGQACLDEDLVEEPVGSDGVVGRLPHNHVSKQGRETRQVAGDGSEVERGDSVHEALERSVFQPVPHACGVVLGLLSIQLLGVLDVESQEVAQLCGGVDLGLPCVLALAEHGGRHDLVSVLGGDQICGLQKDGGPVGEGQRCPRLLGSQGRVNCPLDILRSGF
ncbi:hypothetical protein FJTKL_04315 [Diaporthe vaccinii]|uniref:Uncharacterized protein n=1 Tax=Diaporthe vaccinii TaxID=105482 RepID=A0ABR4F0M2_9PEZI